MGLLDKIRPARLVGFSVDVGPLQVGVVVPNESVDQSRVAVMQIWEHLNTYLMRNPRFRNFKPSDAANLNAPPVINSMVEAAGLVGIKPLMLIAGALVQAMGEELEVLSQELAVSCEGVHYVFGGRSRTFVVDPASDVSEAAVAIRVRDPGPYSVFVTSGRSRIDPITGSARAIGVVAESPTLAEAVGVAMGSALRGKGKLSKVLDVAASVTGVRGGVVLSGAAGLGVWGDIEIATPSRATQFIGCSTGENRDQT